ncbi:DNA/RNA non-specific endonuclease [Nocardiopsis sp. EMB25]|uniref:DNA/RNA non-specific endonuclease n=1 Tax=Nocardiopsis sp. EMB25 TaxID=2835867 RepID=UPI00228379B5|nr:DNA/RNA non-specific endonuclease [Nocardiopsis sp. EMB25]MCY9786887.1 DNA/RNA non-specific endonuclease [Nocardiopsis sp. EMB25]
MTADMCTPNPGGAVNPEAWPIPKVSPSALEGLASRLRSHGSELAGVGQDIKSQWAGLSSCYAAPESETLFAVLDPVATDGDEVEESMDDAASALEDFAERARDIKGRWNTLKTEAEAFLATIDTSTDEWRQAEGWWDRLWGKESGNVGRNNELHAEAVALQQEYEEAERNCANAINAGITGRTNFVAGDLSGEQELDGNDYVHGYEGDLSDVPMAWGAPVETDHGWWVDAGHAVWDYGVGAVEGLGGMVGAYSSEGWFEASWGDAMWEHWEGTVQSAASLVGMYDAEGDSWGWSGWDSVGSAWKDAAHAVVPWEEWGERPGYVIGTALLNIGATVGGAVLTATGVGAVVGVPLMAWRGAAMLDKMGGSRVPDVSLDGIDLSRGLPAYGNPGMPRISVDLSGLNPLRNVDLGRMPDLRGTIDRLLRLNAHDGQGQVPDTGDRSRAGDSDDATRDPTVEQVSESERLLEELGLDPSLSRTFDGMDATAGDYPAWEMSQTPGSPSDAPPPKVPVGAVARADAMEHDGGTGRNQFNLTGTGDDLPDGLDGDRVPDADASHGSPVVTNSAGDGGTTPRNGVTDSVDNGGPIVRQDAPTSGERVDGNGGSGNTTPFRGPNPPDGGGPDAPRDGDGADPADPHEGVLRTASTGSDHASGSDGGGSDRPGGAGGGNDPEARYRPPEVHEDNVHELRKGDKGYPGPNSRFNPRWPLEPNSMYDVKGRGKFYTDDEGRITHVETHAGEKGNRNPELKYPRENATYSVEVLENRGHRYHYETDSESRTVHAHGELQRVRSDADQGGLSLEEKNDIYRAADQGAEGRKGGAEYGSDPEFHDADWDGGHFFGTGFGGSGHTINLYAQLRELNQIQKGTTKETNFFRLEQFWRDQLDAGHDVRVSFEAVYPDEGDVPTVVEVNYSIDGQPQKPIQYQNVPDRRSDSPTARTYAERIAAEASETETSS